MVAFGSAVADADSARAAAQAAAEEARGQLGGARPVLAISFASPGYSDLGFVPSGVSSVLGGVPVVGGTSGGCLIGPTGVSARGVSVVVLGGEGIEVRTRTASLRSPSLVEVVPAAQALSVAADDAASRGFTEFTCLVFAPGAGADGEALVAAVRKGVGPRVPLAGGLTGDDNTYDRTRVFADGEVRGDCAVLTGVFTTRPLGVAARHGFRPVGPTRRVTRSDGQWLVELDGRPAFDVWAEDVRAAGGEMPAGRDHDVTVFLANHYEIGVLDASRPEAVVRCPLGIRSDGAVRLSGGVGEGKRTRVMVAAENGVLEASLEAANAARKAAGAGIGGALVLACTSRMVTLGSDFPRETSAIAKALDAPIGGVCVFGEIARSRRDADAFHNATTMVLAIPSAG
jgi:hypothetical protein